MLILGSVVSAQQIVTGADATCGIAAPDGALTCDGAAFVGSHFTQLSLGGSGVCALNSTGALDLFCGCVRFLLS